jgi:hypothetical protein
MTSQRFHVDTRFIRELPDEAFPFTFQCINADTGEEIYSIVAGSRRATFLMPIYKGRIARVTIRIIWPDGEVTETTRPYHGPPPTEPAPDQASER